MNKRKEQRFKTRHMVKVCGKLGVVNDISADGLQLSTSFSPDSRKVDIAFEVYGEMIQLVGVIQWIKRKRQLQAPNELGIVIKNAPPEYLQFVDTFYT